VNRRVFLRRASLLGVLAAAGCGGGGPSGELTIAGGEKGGLYFDFATLLGQQLGPDLTGHPRATGGSLDNLALLRDGQVELGLTLADVARIADPALDLRVLGRVYENYLQLVVRADDPARTARDLAGRVLSLGAPGAGATLFGDRMLAVLGFAGDGRTTVEHLSLGDAAQALESKRIDALLWSGGIPTPTLSRLDGRIPIRLLPLAELLDALRAAHGSVYEQVPVPAGVYRGEREVPTIGVANLLVCRASLPDDVAAAVARTLVERAAALVPEQALGTQFLDVRSLIGTAGLPLHPGAATTYRTLHG